MIENLIITLFVGFLGGLLGLFFGHRTLMYEMLGTRKTLGKVMGAMYSEKGVIAKKQAKDDTEQAISEGLALISQGKDIKEVGAYLMAKYPGAISPILKSLDIKL